MRFAALVFLALIIPSSAYAGPLEDGIAAYKNGDYPTAMKVLRPLADQGNAQAEYSVGQMFENGQGVPTNVIEAMKWYGAARRQGYPQEKLEIPPNVDFKEASAETNKEAEKRLREVFSTTPYKLEILMPDDKTSMTILGPFLSGYLEGAPCKTGAITPAGISKLDLPFPVQPTKQQIEIMQAEMTLMQPLIEKLSGKKLPPIDISKDFAKIPPMTLFAAKNSAERKNLAAALEKKIRINARPVVRSARNNELAQEMMWKRMLDHVGEKEKLKINAPVLVIDDGTRRYLFNFYPDGKSLYWIEDVSGVSWFP